MRFVAGNSALGGEPEAQGVREQRLFV